MHLKNIGVYFLSYGVSLLQKTRNDFKLPNGAGAELL